jgi:hypothetical protein
MSFSGNRRISAPTPQVGYIVAVMMKNLYDALVCWIDADPIFEVLDDLIEAVHQPV